jgi:hypothetical protein
MEVESVVVAEGVKKIRPSSFVDYTALTSVVFPPRVKRIEESAFNRCSSLSSINLPPNLHHIGNHAFSHTALTSISIPDSVTNVNGFGNCDSLTTVGLRERR